ncbi:MAG: dynamin family protein, partial [Firmicutes bacterium]|nr:dynamin family protein [Bacillota bacterium]
NPTTAVITRITAPTAERPHGHVHVIWKTPDQLRLEVDRALTALGLPATGDTTADLATGARQSRAATAPFAKPHAAFLAAAARGYAAVQHSLGREEAAGLAQFASLVADEQRSCFVAEIMVYIDCPVTRQGITLVDTPGADSINARHTDVAFDYIKNADAILFVTYYNHAFSRADSDFLTQLGRVKDSFALDKMFFVINAADLATDAEELDLVASHVRQNLQACGIRQARIFPVSSQTALWRRLQAAGRLPQELAAKLPRRGPSGMERFEAEFYRFVVTDLSQMAVDGALAELRRALQTIGSWLEAAHADDGARAARLQALRAAEDRALSALTALDAAPEAAEVAREIDELLYYVRRRVLRERFRDGFTLAFNPSVLRPDSLDLKRALREALAEVLQFVSFDLAQEMRATALRVENVVNRQAERVQLRAVGGVAQHLPQWSGPVYSPIHLPVPTFTDAHLSPDQFLKLLGLFRSPERFFAGGGRDELSEQLSQALAEPVSAYLGAARETLAHWYGDALHHRVEAMQGELITAVADHGRGLTVALTGAGSSAQLETILQALQ